MKIPRFVKEYRNYLVADIKNDEFISKDVARLLINDIDKYVRACEAGLVSVRECMERLSR